MPKVNDPMPKKAIVLLSGGLDSITVLALAQQQGYTCYALSFDYGQRHNAELVAAAEIAADYQVEDHKIIKLGLGSIGGSALTDEHIAVPSTLQAGIPVTYVPARNTIFLSFALGWAEVLNLSDIFIGVNAVDYSGYPDCRPEFIQAFQQLANLATKAGVEGGHFTLHTPLIALTKAEIIKQGAALGVNYQRTVSCYSADKLGRACGICDACRLRAQGFIQASIADPTRYQK
jgi:7-cyano-7-deazaguanine synthase